MQLRPGLDVTASVRLVRMIGEGGMGSVWVADHRTLHTQVAVKFMSEHLVRSPEAAARFGREASAAAQIKSPHVVQIFDHGFLAGQVPYIVMELLEGETLSSFIKRHQGVLSIELVAQIVAQMCKALARAHSRNVIHRDVKPDNVFLVDSDGEVFVKLLDFGVAKRLEENLNVTSTGAVMGTAHYMSPEQMLSSKHVDARSDLWAVGVVAYQCITGRMPFDGETFAGIAMEIAWGEFSLPYAGLGVGSPELDAWFSRALAREQAQRFGSAREIAEAFSAAAAAGGVRAGTLNNFGGSEAAKAPSWSDSSSRQGPDPVAARPTFTGVAATMNRPSSHRLYAVGAIAALALVFAVIGAVAFIRLSGSDGKLEPAHAEQHAQPAPAAPPNIEPASEDEPRMTPRPVAVTPPSAAVTPAVAPANTPAKVSTKPPEKVPAQKVAGSARPPRPAMSAPPKDPPKPAAVPVITDRGF